MSENAEHAMEHVTAGILFCTAVAMLIWLHGTFLQQILLTGTGSVQLILVEQREEAEWNRSVGP